MIEGIFFAGAVYLLLRDVRSGRDFDGGYEIGLEHGRQQAIEALIDSSQRADARTRLNDYVKRAE